MLRDLVAFLQFKKRENHPWRSVIFSKVADWVFFTFLKILQMLPNRAKHHIVQLRQEISEIRVSAFKPFFTNVLFYTLCFLVV